MQVFAILGSHPSLSLAEIEAVTGAKPTISAGQAAIFDTLEGELSTLNNRLGGVQKMGHIIGEIAKNDLDDLVDFLVAQLIENSRESKLHFGISVYDFSAKGGSASGGGDTKEITSIARRMQHLGLSIKTALKAEGRSARFVAAKDAALNAVAVVKNELLKKGAEFVLLVGKETMTIGMTVAVQNAEDWSKRDFDRPRRNAKQGMLPPKLARMMINLSGFDPVDKTLLDPFCGSGTVLMEGALLGAGHLIGGDIASGAIHDTRENMAWMKKQGYAVSPTELFTSDAEHLVNHVAPNSVDLLITETYLGKPRQGAESREVIVTAMNEISELYRTSFTALRPVLKPGAVIVLATPIHFIDREAIEPDVQQVLEVAGYTHHPITSSPLTYHRPEQFVGRKFYRFTIS